MYSIVKYSHAFLAIVSITGFALRGYWMMTGSELLAHRSTRIAPHVVDTLFLVTGIWLVVLLNLPVVGSPWLLAKLAGLVAYIVLGTIALRRGRTMPVRLVAFVGALAIYAYIVGVAISKSPASWLVWIAR